MATYEINFVMVTGRTGLTLRAQLKQFVGGTLTDYGAEITEDFEETNLAGVYAAEVDVESAFTGFISFYVSGDTSDEVAFFPINPRELENADVKTSTINTALGDIWSESVPASYNSGTAGYALGRIGNGTFNVTVAAPVLPSGNVETFIGDDYSNSDGRALDWTQSSGDGWPSDLTGATITVVVKGKGDFTGASFTGSVVTATGSSKKVRLELTDEESDNIAQGTFDYQVQATLTSGRKAVLVSGEWTSLERVSI